jgi:hypothetical protein
VARAMNPTTVSVRISSSKSILVWASMTLPGIGPYLVPGR